MRAMAWMTVAAMVGGCAPETDGVFTSVDELDTAPERCTADADCGPGVRCGSNKVCAVLTPVECSAAEDCPRLECHDGPLCMGGRCVSVVTTVRYRCNGGVCNDAGQCIPCLVNAECAAVNMNECAELICVEGDCQARKMDAGSPCNLTAGGACDDSSFCVPGHH